MKYRLIVIFFCFTSLLGCGGGSSSSGGGSVQMQNDVTSCINQETRIIDLFGNRSEEIIFTNTCDFSVNLALANVAGLSPQDVANIGSK